MTATGMFIWAELVTKDQAASGEFYSKLIGWTRHEQDMGPSGKYTVFKLDGEDAAGMTNPFNPELPAPYWHTYIGVKDVDAVARKAAELGGKIINPPADFPGVGRLCLIRDPQGAYVSLMTPVAVEVE